MCIIFLLFIGCTENGDVVLNSFHGFQKISPVDSVDIEEYDILMPHQIQKKRELLIFSNARSKKHLSIYDMNKKEVFNKIDLGQGPYDATNISLINTTDTNSIVFYNMGQNKIQMFSVDSLLNNPEIQQKTIFTIPKGNWLAGLVDVGDYYVGYGVITVNDSRFIVIHKQTGEISYQGAYPDIEAFQSLQSALKGMMFASSQLVPKPDGKKFVSVLQGLMEIYAVSSKGELELSYKGYHYPPDFSVIQSGGGQAIAHGKNDVAGYVSVNADDKYIYVLYSDQSRANKYASEYWYCKYLLLYDWDGKPVKGYELSNVLTYVSIDKNTVYGMDGQMMMYVYKIE
jgi:hypothetical protein